ncbi:MAG: alpha/beta hydrolase fold domain-containing protein [Planctomycetaceae bacterium]|jgi:acetyl esterase/lipase|nr:alpha/beta hydrolase fold domain-containing protein [Planctomycetaceae bacterium]
MKPILSFLFLLFVSQLLSVTAIAVTVPKNVIVKENIPYVTGGGERQQLDLYLPNGYENAAKPYPVIVVIHGGAWAFGAKDMNHYMFDGLFKTILEKSDYILASINYRLTGTGAFPMQLEDCKSAIRWLRANAKTYNIDTEHVGVWGGSAGGHLAALVGTTSDVKEFDVGENLDQSSRPQAVCDVCGSSDLMLTVNDPNYKNIPWIKEIEQFLGKPIPEAKNEALRASATTYVTKNDPPFLMIHGTADTVNRFAHAERLKKALDDACVTNILYPLKDTNHDGPLFVDPKTLATMMQFFDRYLKPIPERRYPEQNRPKLFVSFPDHLHNPDGMTYCPKTKKIFVNFPNFNNMDKNLKKGHHEGGYLVRIDPETAAFEVVLEYPILEDTGQTGPMGLAFGPDNHLYVCDTQWFHSQEHKSRILRVIMKDGKPTGEVQIVATGTKVSNAILWLEDKMLITDTYLELPGKYGTGGVWMFTKEEALNAGKNGTPTIRLKPNGTDPHLIIIEEVTKTSWNVPGGADGLTVDENGVVYFCNFGDGSVYALTFDKENKPACRKIFQSNEINCCDGMFYDKRTGRSYIADSQLNAVHAVSRWEAGKDVVFETIWANGDTNGADGLLDSPCEPIVVGNKLYIANFDSTSPKMVNTKHDAPHTISVITLIIESGKNPK